MSVKEMYVIPKEVYHTIMNELSENEKRLVNSINVDKVNLSYGPLFAGVRKDEDDDEEKKTKKGWMRKREKKTLRKRKKETKKC